MRRLDNATARAVFLSAHGLADTPAGPAKGDDLHDVIHKLGFVQVDSVRTVERAHHMILFSRRPTFRPARLPPLVERDRRLFEHWTHDAALIPMAFWPHWRLKCARDAETLRARWGRWQGRDYESELSRVLRHVQDHGPVQASDLSGRREKSTGWWDWHPSKTALEYLWRSGDLAITRREGFRKVYDLTERVIPASFLDQHPAQTDSIDWLCGAALDRLGFATPGEIAAFWDIVPPDEARDWVAARLQDGAVEPVEVTCADGSARRGVARTGLDARVPDRLPGRIRALSPFDPALRDRARTLRLFGFHYRIEIFTPAHKRRYGYYVFPLLEGSRLVGRIDMRANRDDGTLEITALWPEPGLRWGARRDDRLDAELARIARFAGLDHVRHMPGWRRSADAVP